MLQTVRVHAVPTTEQTALRKDDGEWADGKSKLCANTIHYQHYHLCFTNDDVIKPGDMCLAIELGEVFECKENNTEQDYLFGTNGIMYHTNTDPFMVRKIVASTDTKLIWPFSSSVEKIPDSFIESYNEDPVTRVRLEMYDEQRFSHFSQDLMKVAVYKKTGKQLPVTKDGEIVIHPAWRKIYTEEDMKRIAIHASGGFFDKDGNTCSPERWFEEYFKSQSK